MLKKLSLALLLVFLSQQISFCDFFEKPNFYLMKEILDSWKDESLDTIMKYWGYPDKEKNIAGKILLYWESGYKGYSQNPFTSFTEVNYNEYYLYCNRIIEINKSNEIVNMTYDGNNCPILHNDFRYKIWVNPEKSYFKYKEEQKQLRKQAKEKQRLEKQAAKQAKKK